MSVSTDATTLERFDELREIDAAFEAGGQGDGRLVLVEGPPGIGKTHLLREAAARAPEGFEVLRARGDELEAGLPFGVVLQLFEGRLARATGEERDALFADAAALARPLLLPHADPETADAAALRRGLYWLTSNLTGGGPLALIVDDLHWADAQSLEWLGYLARRLEGLPLVVLAASRQAEAERSHLIGSLIDGQGTQLTPQPLSRDAVGRLLQELSGSEPDPGFAEACMEATGGNPFLLRELALAAVREGAPASTPAAIQVGGLAPATVARAVLVRVARLPAAAATLARSVAVLGRDVPLDLAAEHAELDPGEAADAADALAAAYVLGSERLLTFIHPIVRAAIEEEMPPTRRRAAHARAAQVLRERGAGPERVAAHLMIADPAGSSEAMATLREAAARARERGAGLIAVTYLTRALEEGPVGAERAELLRELGSTAASAADPRALDWLAEAYDTAADPAERGRTALARGRALFQTGRMDEAFEAIDGAEADLGDAERGIVARLEAELISTARLDPRLRPLVPERIERLERLAAGDPFARRLLVGQRSYEAALAGEPAESAAAMAREALLGDELLDELGPEDATVHTAINTLAITERLDESQSAFDKVIALARRRGSALGFTIASAFRAQTFYRRGELRRAEADARAAIEVADAEGWGLGIPAARAFLVYALVERGELEEAERTLAALGEEIPDVVMFDPVLDARGRVRIAAGRLEDGVADLLACGERQERWGAHNPSVIPWRSMAAEGMLRDGRVDEARPLADEEVALARRAGAPRALGMSLRVAGLVHGDQALLEEAVDVLDRGPSPLESARARATLGAMLRRRGSPTVARDHLKAALDEADRAGATALASEARAELIASGARPRRARLSGPDSLTASELRVATLAARGSTNREIAQSLFVTVKTVETHLGNAYRKLEISSRGELPAALAGDA